MSWQLILEWIVGIVVLVRCFSDQTKFDQEIVNKLGSSFPRVAFIVVLVTPKPIIPLLCRIWTGAKQ